MRALPVRAENVSLGTSDDGAGLSTVRTVALVLLVSFAPSPARAQRAAELVVEGELVARSRTPECRRQHVAGVAHYRVQRVLAGRIRGRDLYAIIGCPGSPRRSYGPQWADRAVLRTGAVHRLALTQARQPWRGMRLYDDFAPGGGRRWWVTRIEVPADRGPLFRMQPRAAPVLDRLDAAQVSLVAPVRWGPDDGIAHVRVEAPSTWWDRLEDGRLTARLTLAGQSLHLVRVEPERLDAQLPRVRGGRHTLMLELSAPNETRVVVRRAIVVEELRVLHRFAGRESSDRPWWQLEATFRREHAPHAAVPYVALVTTRPDPFFFAWIAILVLLSAFGWSWASGSRRATHVGAILPAGRSYRDSAHDRWQLQALACPRELADGIRCLGVGAWRLVVADRPVAIVRPNGRSEVRKVFLISSDTSLSVDGVLFAFVDGESAFASDGGPKLATPDVPLDTTRASDGASNVLRRSALAVLTTALAAGTCIAASDSARILARAPAFVLATLVVAAFVAVLARVSGAAVKHW